MIDSSRSAPRGHSDRGFTLIELVVAVTIVGMLSVAVLGGITSILRTVPLNTRNIGESHDQQQLLNYFVPDVRSTAPGSVDSTPTAGGCTGADAGVNVAQLTWLSGGTTSRSSYRVITVAGVSRLDRYVCTGTSATTLGAPTIINILDTIDPVPTNWSGGTAPAYITTSGNVVTLKVTQSATKRTLSVASTLRSDVSTLVAPTGTTTAATTTTVAATTTTAAATTTTASPTTTTTAATTTTTAAATTTTAAATTTTVAANSGTPLNPVAAAQGFMVMTSGNALIQVSSLQGGVAAGGNLSFKNYENIATSAPSSFAVSGESAATGLMVGGTVDWTSSSGSQLTVANGLAHTGTLTSGSVLTFGTNVHIVAPNITDNYTTPRIVVSADQSNQTTNAVQRPGAFLFASAFTTLRNSSAKLAALNPTTCSAIAYPSVTQAYGNYTLTLVAGKVNVWNVSVADLNAMANLTSPSNPDATTKLVVNVTDYGSITLPTRYWSTLQNGQKSSILWNVPNATAVSVSNAIYGTLFAPNADVTASGMQLYGDLIAKTLSTNGGDSTLAHFDTSVPCVG
ncbi:MAG: hypothetical protein JWM34_1383 [Ilumatobacteraceae bacterium]|nr:hypothetical protein [Ilumatobacteraceae bacterium]